MSKKTKKRPRATLQHHRHTGRVVAHQHTHYPALFLLLLVVGVFLACFQYSVVRADNLEVTAKISAPIPTVPAVIQEPTNGQTVTDRTVAIQGTCQITNPSVVIVIIRQSEVMGSTTCRTDGTFSVDITLRPGQNQLIAQSFNITSDAGPGSTMISITYDVPTASQEPSEQTAVEAPPTKPDEQPGKVLSIQSEVAFMVFGPGKPAHWKGAVEGGTPPYAMTIAWDDGSLEMRTNLGTEALDAAHNYSKIQTYFVTVTASDTNGQSVEYHLAAVTPARAVSAMASPIHPESGSSSVTFAKVYTTYAATVAIGTLAFYEAHVLQFGLLSHSQFATQKIKFPKIGRFR